MCQPHRMNPLGDRSYTGALVNAVSPKAEDFSRDRAVRTVRRWLPLMLAAGVVAATVSVGVSLLIRPLYLATAQLYIAPASNQSVVVQDVVLGQNVARTYARLLDVDVVLEPAAGVVGWTDMKLFRERSTASQIRDTSIISVTFLDESPQLAADAANAIANSFISQSRALQTSLQGTAVLQLEAQISSVQRDLDQLDTQIAGLRADVSATARPGASVPPKADLQAELAQLDGSRALKQQTLAQLLKTRDDMRLASSRAESTVTLWQPATPPIEPESPRILLNGIFGGVVGLAVALIAVLLIAYFDDRIRDLEELQNRLGVTPLGQVHLGERPDSYIGKLFVRDEPSSTEAEAFRSARTNIQFASVDSRPRSLLITSAVPREGKSVVSANLALAFAQAGTPTILVDGDLRRPSQHRLFKVSAATGLTSLLTDPANITTLQHFEVGPNLIVIPSGPLPPNPAELLASSRMSSIVDQLVRLGGPNGVVIIDTSPVLPAADAAALATKVDGTIVVVDSTRTRARATLHAINAIRRVQGQVIGALLNKVSVGDMPYYYYYNYRYGSGYQSGRSVAAHAVTSAGRSSKSR